MPIGSLVAIGTHHVHTATENRPTLKTLHNEVEVRLPFITTTGMNLPNHLSWLTVTLSSLKLKVTSCVLSHHQNTAGGDFQFQDFLH